MDDCESFILKNNVMVFQILLKLMVLSAIRITFFSFSNVYFIYKKYIFFI